MTIEEFTGITKALSDQNRVRAFMALLRGELCSCQIIELLSLAPSTVSKHMSILKTAGLVESRKDSRWVYYKLTESNKRPEILEFIKMSISLLRNDQNINEDDNRMKIIISDGLEALCKKQKGFNW
ncbi:MAG: winged helix-turn-helix transcriptional regulator [Fibrobacter sp.]|nr:winged helix-turn-helix transcriptional regulator [Fibrobacter sp.]